MDKVLVTKAIRPNYNTLGGGPVMVVGGNQGRGSRGRTGLERLGRGIGGLVGVTGALTGQHRSLGSLANAMVSGGAQGSAILGGLGRAASGRTGRARANLREQAKQAQALREAELAEKYRNEGRGFGIGARNRRRAFENQERLNRINEADRQRVAVMNAQNRDFNRSANRIRRATDRAFGREYGQQHREMKDRGREFTDMFNAYGASEEDIRAAQDRAAGMQPINAQGQPVDPMLQLPPPMGAGDTAAAEIKRDEDIGTKKITQEGLDTQRSKTVEGQSLREIQEAEFEENEQEPQENRVGVVDPNSLRGIQSRRERGV